MTNNMLSSVYLPVPPFHMWRQDVDCCGLPAHHSWSKKYHHSSDTFRLALSPASRLQTSRTLYLQEEAWTIQYFLTPSITGGACPEGTRMHTWLRRYFLSTVEGKSLRQVGLKSAGWVFCLVNNAAYYCGTTLIRQYLSGLAWKIFNCKKIWHSDLSRLTYLWVFCNLVACLQNSNIKYIFKFQGMFRKHESLCTYNYKEFIEILI